MPRAIATNRVLTWRFSLPVALATAAGPACRGATPPQAARPETTTQTTVASEASAVSGTPDASAGRSEPATDDDRGPLALRPGGPTLVVGAGSRIESIDPETGAALGAIAPIRLPGFAWERFLKRGRFLLAEGRGGEAAGPVAYFLRGLTLIDETGRVLWTKTQAMMLNRVSHALFLDEEGSVAYDSLAGAGLIARDGSVLDTGLVPAGPVERGARDFIPLRNWCVPEASSWLRLDTRQYADSPPDFIVDALPLHASIEDGRVSFVATVDPYPENDFLRFGVRTVARIPASPECQDPNRAYVAPTLSPRHEILECWERWQEGSAGPVPSALFVVDLHAHAVRRIRPPASDASGPSPRMRDAVAATVRADGSVVATVWNECTSAAYVSEPAAAWKRIAVTLSFGPPVEPAPICGRLTLRPGTMPPNMGCHQVARTLNPEDVTYVEQPDGTWLTLPYEVLASRRQDCAGDGGFAAFVRSGALVVTRFDRVGLRVIRPGFGSGPFAWLP